MAAITAGYEFVSVADGTEMALYVARPSADKAETAPCIIVLQEAFGLNGHMRNVTERLAREGYLAVAPELFHRTAAHGFAGSYDDMPAVMKHYQAVSNETLTADLEATHAWLLGDAQAITAKLASIGFCMGGRASWFANTILPLQAAVAFYGGGIDPAQAARQQAPLLLFWAGLDHFIDLQHRSAVAAALRDAGKIFAQVEYSDADHGFFCDERASYNADAAHESWALALAFLQRRLR